VLSRVEWLDLRKEYKDYLYQQQQAVYQASLLRSTGEFVPGVLVEASHLSDHSVAGSLDKFFSSVAPVQYVDYTRGSTTATVRFKSAEGAAAVLRHFVEKQVMHAAEDEFLKKIPEAKSEVPISTRIMAGDEETQYWKKIQEARRKKEELKKKKGYGGWTAQAGEGVARGYPSNNMEVENVEEEGKEEEEEEEEEEEAEETSLSTPQEEKALFEAPKRKRKPAKKHSKAEHMRFADSDIEEADDEETHETTESTPASIAEQGAAQGKKKKNKKKKKKGPAGTVSGPRVVSAGNGISSDSGGEGGEAEKEIAAASRSQKRKAEETSTQHDDSDQKKRQKIQGGGN